MGGWNSYTLALICPEGDTGTFEFRARALSNGQPYDGLPRFVYFKQNSDSFCGDTDFTQVAITKEELADYWWRFTVTLPAGGILMNSPGAEIGVEWYYLPDYVWPAPIVYTDIVLASPNLNGDESIDLSDIAVFTPYSNGSLPYDVRVDFNHDGSINLADIAIFTQHNFHDCGI